ncbi:MAG: 4-hydroxy-tetrahydrodipicolinate synthase [Bradymonadia bacterium]
MSQSTTDRPLFSGIYTALITPFVDGAPDLDGVARLVERQIAAGVDGVVPCGTTGESATLSADEQARVIEQAVKTADGRCQIIAGVGSNNTATAVELAQRAKALGADGGLTITPYYNKPGQEGMYRHFAAVQEANPGFPLVLYNVPGRTNVSLSVETCLRLAELPDVVAIKEATADLAFNGELIAALGDRMAVLSGEDSVAFPLWCIGGHGVIAVASNAVPERLVAMWKAFQSGDWLEARRLHLALMPLFKANFCETNPTPIKALVSWMVDGISPEGRLPLVPFTEAGADRLRGVCRGLEIPLPFDLAAR